MPLWERVSFDLLRHRSLLDGPFTRVRTFLESSKTRSQPGTPAAIGLLRRGERQPGVGIVMGRMSTEVWPSIRVAPADGGRRLAPCECLMRSTSLQVPLGKAEGGPHPSHNRHVSVESLPSDMYTGPMHQPGKKHLQGARSPESGGEGGGLGQSDLHLGARPRLLWTGDGAQPDRRPLPRRCGESQSS